MWDLSKEDDPLAERLTHHTEFVVGIDFNLFTDEVVSASWDEKVCVWRTNLK